MLINPYTFTPPDTLYDGLIGAWNFNNNTNTSYGALNGTPNGGFSYMYGILDSSMAGNSVDAYMSLPNNCLNFNTDFTINVWVFIIDDNNLQAIISNHAYDGTTAYGWGFWMNNGNMQFSIYNAIGTNNVSLTTPIWYRKGSWQMFTILRQKNIGTKIYGNSVLEVSNTSATNPVYSNGSMLPSIGAINYGSSVTNFLKTWINGEASKIDGLSIWNRALSDAEILRLWNKKQYPYL